MIGKENNLNKYYSETGGIKLLLGKLKRVTLITAQIPKTKAKKMGLIFFEFIFTVDLKQQEKYMARYHKLGLP